MHLWQIRHIPNRPQTLLKLTFLAAAVSAFAVTFNSPMTFVLSKPLHGATQKAGASENAVGASEFFGRVRQELQKHQSISADLAQSVSIGDQQFKVTGKYLSSGNSVDGLKLRLSYTVIPDQGASGKMLEVCDGKELWTLLELPDSKRVTHRNILQIQKAAASVPRDRLETGLNIDLGLGGLTALLASLEKTMVFDAIKENHAGGRNRTIIQGHWKKEFAQRFQKEKDETLPAYVPDAVHLYVDSETLFPERLLYLKKQSEKKTLKPLVSLEFQNVVFDGPIEDASFVFDIPPEVIPEDITKIYLDRIGAPAVAPPPKK